jgi:ppGpp synthetase/RelA/SpoT-type nucleotidyltranferase
MNTQDFIDKYVSELQPAYRIMAIKVQELLTSILSNHAIRTHSITSREKSSESLKAKIGREGKAYENPLDEITDLAGVRIITYFPSDVDKILPIIEKEFIIDQKNSIDKRKATDPSIFGYVSVHLVIEFSPDRIKLPEYKIFRGMKCEVQVRTILQHAWAEIEHDIVYKASEDIPFELRRQFASLAGLLEIADKEFETLRHTEIKVREEIEQTIKKDNISIPINLESLRFYLNRYHKEKKISPERLSRLNKFIREKNISTLDELHKLLTKSIVSKAAQEADRLKSACPSIDRCLVKYFLALGYHFGINRKDLGIIARCPILIDKKGFLKRKILRSKKDKLDSEVKETGKTQPNQALKLTE